MQDKKKKKNHRLEQIRHEKISMSMTHDWVTEGSW